MAKLKIVKFGDPTLRKVARPVTEITPRIITLLDDMIEKGVDIIIGNYPDRISKVREEMK